MTTSPPTPPSSSAGSSRLEPGADALLAPTPQPTPAAAVTDQKPRGQRLRRTTLPRSTRGWSRGIVWSLIGLTSFATIYGLIARIETSVNATGKLRPIGGVTDISAPFNAPVVKLLVKEGQTVKVGQPLIQVRDASVRDQLGHLLDQRNLWLSQLNVIGNRLGLPVVSPTTPFARRQLSIEKQDVELRVKAAIQERLRSQVNLEQQASDLLTLKRRQAIETSITSRMMRLVQQGALSRLELDRQQQRSAELSGLVKRTEKELESARYRVRESQLKQQQIPAAELKQLYAQYANARLQLSAVDASIDELNDRIQLGRLVAPVAGQVFDLNAKPGEILTPARPALKIVPRTRLEVALSISNRDIGFLQPGMPVDVRVTSFPFTDYGALKGTITRIGADALPPTPQNPQESFPVVVKINANELSRKGRSYQLRAGMEVSALIQLGSRPVIALISDRFGGFMESTRSIR